MLRLAAEKRQRCGLLALFLCLFTAACSGGQPGPAGCEVDVGALRHYTVAAITDGDTLRLAGGERVRLIGINTPELGHGGTPDEPLAREARDALGQLLAGGEVWLDDGVEPRDAHGRRLAWAFDGRGHSVSAALLARGLGFHVAIAPNHGRAACLAAAERTAREAGRGVWSVEYYRFRPAAGLAPGYRGFALVEDRVTHVSFKENGWWVQLGGKVGVHIRPQDEGLYSRAELAALEGRSVRARGWLVPMPGHWWVLTLGHPSMLETGSAK